MTTFADPGQGISGDTLKPADVNGHLLICYAVEYLPSFVTPMGDDPVVRVNVADVDTGEFYENVLWWPKMLISALRDRVNQPVLARMGQGQAKPAQSPPWVLNAASGDPDAVARAEAWLQANPGRLSGQALASPAPAQPAPEAQPAPAQPVGQPAGSLI